jgi:hypothetical protein
MTLASSSKDCLNRSSKFKFRRQNKKGNFVFAVIRVTDAHPHHFPACGIARHQNGNGMESEVNEAITLFFE